MPSNPTPITDLSGPSNSPVGTLESHEPVKLNGKNTARVQRLARANGGMGPVDGFPLQLNHG